jgi:hypothetical protein
MSKTTKDRPGTSRSGTVREDAPLIPPKYQHVAAIGLLFLSLVLFFHAIIFQGMTFLGVDTIASHSWDTVLKEAKSEGVFPLWNPYIFCGFPGYGSLTFAGTRIFDISSMALGFVDTLLGYLFLAPPEGWVLGFYFIFAIGMYFFVFSKIGQKVPSLIAALGATFSMYIISWVPAGHNTKIAVMAFFPIIFLIVEKLRQKFDWRLAVVLVFVLHFSFLPAHVQMIFYTFLSLGVYFLFFLLRTLIKKEDWKSIVRTGVVLAVAAVLALSMDTDKYLSVWEYNPYSMRGSTPAVQAPGAEKTIQGGLAYDYATAWSFGVGEMATFFVPSWYGFGTTTYQGPLTNNQAIQQNFYFGPEPFTDSPQYMGVVILIFAIIGFIRYRKNPFVQYLGIMCLFSLLVAFGKEFPLVYDPMFKYFPMFNKFRGPSMILTIVQILIPILAAYGVASFIGTRQQNISPATEKKWKYSLAGLGALFVLAVFAPGIYKSFYSEFVPIQSVARRFGSNQQVVTMLYEFFSDKVATDFLFAFGFLFVAFGAIYRYVHQKLSFAVVASILVIVVVADLWRIDFQPMDPKPRTEQSDIFTAPNYVRYLQQDTSLYRVLLFENGRPPYDNKLAYWKIQSAYGYQGAKMRWYQDIDDVAGMGNPLVWQLMDVKYIISNTPDSSQVLSLVYNGPQYKVYLNRAHLPRAFFVNRYEVTSGIDMLRKMESMSFDVRDVAFFTEDPHLTVEPPKDGARAEYVHYGLQDVVLNVTATGNNLLFLSESYYPNGWKAYLDGNEIPIYRMDYLFRGVVVPAGTHKLEMKFEPRSFYMGKNASLGMNVVLIGVLLIAGYDVWRKKKLPVAPTQSSSGQGGAQSLQEPKGE